MPTGIVNPTPTGSRLQDKSGTQVFACSTGRY
jgi:hypothetical protein